MTGVAFNDAYRYVDWLLTVPLLLIELILVMRLSRAETNANSASRSPRPASLLTTGVEEGGRRPIFWGAKTGMPRSSLVPLFGSSW
ncbi:MAG: hypothetical protein B7X78_05290 [Sphingomonadales bacterium 39-62-4]|nr:MAG: hypothetical protein B7X78_05290 [Sphingomonadales bacterium 39-62-4]